jgi:hypothetical protein
MSTPNPRRSAAPHIVDQVVLPDDPVAVAHQLDKKIEQLGFERHRLGRAAQLVPLDIQHVIAIPKNHLCSAVQPDRAIPNKKKSLS